MEFLKSRLKQSFRIKDMFTDVAVRKLSDVPVFKILPCAGCEFGDQDQES